MSKPILHGDEIDWDALRAAYLQVKRAVVQCLVDETAKVECPEKYPTATLLVQVTKTVFLGTVAATVDKLTARIVGDVIHEAFAQARPDILCCAPPFKQEPDNG